MTTLGLRVENVFQAVDAVFSSVAADAEVRDSVVVASLVEVALQVVGVAFAGRGAITGGERVSEGDDDGTGVVGVDFRDGGCG